MTPLTRGLVIALAHVALVSGVGGKLLYDRTRLPRVWVETVGVDPYLPIRGRYVELRLVVDVPGDDGAGEDPDAWARLQVRNGRLVSGELLRPEPGAAWFEPQGEALQRVDTPAGKRWTLQQPVAFFLPEEAPDPTRIEPGQVLWAEVTVPPSGPPRPIRLEVR